jgi:hypothetical protein
MHAIVQGNCSSEPSATILGLSEPALVERKPGQCVLVTDVRLMNVKQNLWMDSLYIRHHTTTTTDTPTILDGYGKGCNLWLTSVTLQGDSFEAPAIGGFDIAGGQLYAEGVHVRAPMTQHSRFNPSCGNGSVLKLRLRRIFALFMS